MASQSSIEARVCSVSSNWTALPDFFWMIVARSRSLPPTQRSSIFRQGEIAAPKFAIPIFRNPSSLLTFLIRSATVSSLPDSEVQGSIG
jgi:hypothetical protein